MQSPDSQTPAGDSSTESTEISRLQAEWQRLVEKRGQMTDSDIISVLNMRLKEIEITIEASQSASTESSQVEEQDEQEPEDIQKKRLELQRLLDKRAQTKDKNVIAALDMVIMQIQPTLPPPPKPKAKAKSAKETTEEEDIVGELAPPPTAAQSEQAEKLIRQSMLEKRRGNVVGATDLLKKAADVAPSSVVVLEALADDLLERKLTKQAREIYKRAVKLDPKNVGLERKYAQTVLQSTTTMSVEDQLRYGMSDSLFITGEDNVAGLTAARLFSAIIPGVGQLVLGKNTKGFVLLLTWAVLVAWICLWNKDFYQLMVYFGGKGAAPNNRILIPLIGIAVVWVAAMVDLTGGQSKKVARHEKVARPKPPVDLPFD